ncbi:MAG: hypothetical protein ACTSVY_00375, partial [Candidatus Helarchaeota archaeon]
KVKHVYVPMTIKKENFLVRDKCRLKKAFKMLLPKSKNKDELIKLIKEHGIKTIGSLWKAPFFYIDLESTYPIFSCTILSESNEKQEIAEKYLEKIILQVVS